MRLFYVERPIPLSSCKGKGKGKGKDQPKIFHEGTDGE
jgi:hypothetical protein